MIGPNKPHFLTLVALLILKLGEVRGDKVQ